MSQFSKDIEDFLGKHEMCILLQETGIYDSRKQVRVRNERTRNAREYKINFVMRSMKSHPEVIL